MLDTEAALTRRPARRVKARTRLITMSRLLPPLRYSDPAPRMPRARPGPPSLECSDMARGAAERGREFRRRLATHWSAQDGPAILRRDGAGDLTRARAAAAGAGAGGV